MRATKKSRTSHSSSGKRSPSTKSAGGQRKYSPKAQDLVGREMHEFKRGKLKSGRSGRKVSNPKQAIAIGLSEARRAGVKVPRRKKAA